GVPSEVAPAGGELRDAEDHPEAGHGESEVPAEPRIDSLALEETEKDGALREESADERRDHRADVDAHVEDGEPGVATRIVLGVQSTHHGADVRFEATDADDDEREAEIQECRGRHGQREVAGRDDAAAEQYRLALAEEAVGDPASRQRGE